MGATRLLLLRRPTSLMMLMLLLELMLMLMLRLGVGVRIGRLGEVLLIWGW
jgi:hypothetical protein